MPPPRIFPHGCAQCGRKYSRTPRMNVRGSGGPHAHSTLCCERIGSQFARFPNPAGGVEPAQPESPGAATCCAGGGPGFCVDFFRPASLWAETACVEPRVRRERDWGFPGRRSAAFWPKQQILRPDAFWRRFWEIDLQVHHCWDGRKLLCPDRDATTVCCHPPIVTRCGASLRSVLAAERRFRGRLYGSPSQPSCGDSGPATARSHQVGPIPPIRSSFARVDESVRASALPRRARALR